MITLWVACYIAHLLDWDTGHWWMLPFILTAIVALIFEVALYGAILDGDFKRPPPKP
jgi:hypothetical protein